MLTIVIEALVAWRRGAKVYDIPDAVTSLHHGVLSQVAGFFVRFGMYAVVYDAYHATELPQDALWVWLVALLAYDFFYYWVHRCGHEINVMWAAHVVHHSSEYYNLSTALRQTSTGSFLGWIFYVPMAVAGVPPFVFVVVGLIDLLYQYWVHTELIGRLGWLDRIFVTPSNHRVHHGQNDYCIDRNYGGILIIWDRLFGTFVDEREGEKITYGIRKPLKSFNPLWGNLHYYADLWQGSLKAQGWRAKLGVWLAPPGGWDTPLEHFDGRDFARYSCQTPAARAWYVALQYAVAVPFISHFIAVVPQLANAERAAYAGAIVVTTFTLGMLLEGRRWALGAEMLRLAAFGAAFALLPAWFGFAAPDWLRALVAAYALCSVLWLAVRRSPEAEAA